MNKRVVNIDYFIVLALLKNVSIGYMLLIYANEENIKEQIRMNYLESFELLENLTKEDFQVIRNLFTN